MKKTTIFWHWPEIFQNKQTMIQMVFYHKPCMESFFARDMKKRFTSMKFVMCRDSPSFILDV